MSRSVPYKHQISDVASWRQDQALNATIFILRPMGPTGFLLQEEGESRKYKVLLGDPHTCTCADFKKDKDLCKHICWVFLKKFRLPRHDPLTWQLGLVEREINGLLYGSHGRKRVASADAGSRRDATRTSNDKESTGTNKEDGELVQRPISKDDVCAICQEELLMKRLPVTYCRRGCGNSVHIRCMRVWTEHQKKQKTVGPTEFVTCPICRGDFALLSLLMREVTQTSLGRRGTTVVDGPPVHQGSECARCQTTPIRGKLYKCQQCVNFLLCAVCFNTAVHTEHEFIFRERSHSRWQPAPRTRALPAALVNSLQTRELTEQDYELLMQLEMPAMGSDLRQTDLERLPSWRIRPSSRLLSPGEQCRVCLMTYQMGQQVRRLPDCSHVFHASCLDPWLLHRRPACPVDGSTVLIDPPHTDQAGQGETRRNSTGGVVPTLLARGETQITVLNSDNLTLSGTRVGMCLSAGTMTAQGTNPLLADDSARQLIQANGKHRQLPPLPPVQVHLGNQMTGTVQSHPRLAATGTGLQGRAARAARTTQKENGPASIPSHTNHVTPVTPLSVGCWNPSELSQNPRPSRTRIKTGPGALAPLRPRSLSRTRTSEKTGTVHRLTDAIQRLDLLVTANNPDYP